ncbi:PREDICTED: 1-aminocyclopropane-1-carboxylate oxidase 4-like isoform X2 [Lupinus angustifolius]|uniref:1-aminocyclopropane-1-carboxylate oxidase 4-like isoform X2 n=1 Tax=Lupinus angustifolius TaxID=3871 RepID=UPI00092E49FD|nr:PREDICTED: 1-aminocyclopropane-1-carboxylate oxidase 4-like isoform X2 [Lupinus angustifolius]
MFNSPPDWPEPIIRVQSLSQTCIDSIPERYIKTPNDRPSINSSIDDANIPIIDLSDLYGGDKDAQLSILKQISEACNEWGFFQIVNHGVSPDLMDKARETWRQFFHLPMEVKQKYANSPKTYEGYGSRLGIEKGAILDWSDYYFLHYLPLCLKDYNKWPDLPPSCREVFDDYGKEVVKLSGRLMKALSINLGLGEDFLQNAFGGGMTMLLPDDQVPGLQVRKCDHWITVKPHRYAFIVNIGDQIQVLSNAIYKSVEHRVIVNSDKERVSLAFFYNPKSDIPIEPAKELVTLDKPALYPAMTFDQYRLFIRMRGPRGKSQVESLKSRT